MLDIPDWLLSMVAADFLYKFGCFVFPLKKRKKRIENMKWNIIILYQYLL